jgi:hypothetical protein
VVEDGSARIDNVGEFVLEQGGQESGWLLAGLVDIETATKALAAANEAHALSIDPHAVDSMIKKLTAMQDELDKVAGESSSIATDTPLGGGYANEVGRINHKVGTQVLTEIVPKLTQAIDDLKAEIDKSRKSYQTVDAASKNTLDNT